MKKILITFIALMLICSVSVGAVTVEFIIDSPTMAKVQNGTADRNLETSPLLAAPYIANDRTMVPVRAVAESFDCNVGWDAPTRKVTITSSDKEINLFIDSTLAYVNGQEVTLDVAPQIRNDITFVPVRFVTENMGYNVAYIPDVRSVLIYDKENISEGETTAIYPLYDILNYTFYTQYGAYPSQMIMEEARASSLYYKDIEKIALENSLTIAKEYKPDAKTFELCYDNNILKGEYSAYMTSNGYNSAVYDYYVMTKQDEIMALYNAEYVCAKHILISDKTTANKVYKSAKSGKDFDKLIKEYGEDPGMTANPDGYVFTKGEMVKEFEDASYALKENAISKPVETQFGYHIIKRLPLPDLTVDKMYEFVHTMYCEPIIQKYMK